MRINIAVPEKRVTAPVLDGALEAVTRLDEALIREGAVPPFREAVDAVRWRPEPPGEEHFDHAGKVLARGHGDCDDLAPWHAASLRVTGEDPDAQAVVKKSGEKRWHAVVQRGDGTIEDPSREAGMGSHTVAIEGHGLPMMHRIERGLVNGVEVQRPQFSLRPIVERGIVVGFQSRIDLPWDILSEGGGKLDAAMAALHRAPVASQAIVGACRGAVRLGEESEFVAPEVLERVEAVGHYIDGVPIEEIYEAYGPEHGLAAEQVGAAFFKMLGRGLKKIALPIASKVLQFIPGVGPVASTALDMGAKGIEAAVKAGKAAKKRRLAATANITSPGASSLISPAECVRILANAHGVRVGDDVLGEEELEEGMVVVGEDGDVYEVVGADDETVFLAPVTIDEQLESEGNISEVGRFKFGKVFKKILMPHTLITDRIKSKGLRRVLDPSSFVHENLGRRKRKHRHS
jgi:hypothetical protein